MKEIIVKSQAEFDALPKTFSEATRILIESPENVWLSVSAKIENQYVEAWGIVSRRGVGIGYNFLPK